jgi:pantoate--beta-alanine ligase
MELVDTIDRYRAVREGLSGRSVGFVPTMGALHEGHASLIRRSVADCDFTVVSVYINPTQFDNPDDLDSYPATLDEDMELAGSLGADLLFAPNYVQMYPDEFRFRVDETTFSRELCGAHRPGHFTGVLTVVLKLLNIVRPDRAYFGEKDYQQFRLIRDMADAFFLDVEIVGCPVVREEDGLALSSRNVNLDCAAREKAPMIHKLIAGDASDEEVGEQLTRAGFKVDYVVSKYGRRFAAARIGEGAREVRLIDNVALPRSQS